jgi:hypothetical protein
MKYKDIQSVRTIYKGMLKSIDECFFKKKLKSLINTGHPDGTLLYDATIGTALVYSKQFKLLLNNGFRNVIEIAPGEFSIAALTLKAAILDRRLTYSAVDSDQELSRKLNANHTFISLRTNIITEDFEAYLDKCQSFDSIICFEHSLEDLFLTHFATVIGIDYQSWRELLEHLDNIQLIPSRDSVVQFLTTMFDKIDKFTEEYKSCFVLHHYQRPYYECDILRRIDEIILAEIPALFDNKWININPSQNYVNEFFYCGGVLCH